jgi:hypothetical protein
VCDVDTLRREVVSVISQQTRLLVSPSTPRPAHKPTSPSYLSPVHVCTNSACSDYNCQSVQRASPEEVERASRQLAEEGGAGATAPQQQGQFTTAIASTSLAAVLALQLSYGIEGAFHRHVRSLGHSSAGASSSSVSSLFRFLCCSVSRSQQAVQSLTSVSGNYIDYNIATIWKTAPLFF